MKRADYWARVALGLLGSLVLNRRLPLSRRRSTSTSCRATRFSGSAACRMHICNSVSPALTNLRFPDNPEGVALALAYLIDQREPAPDLLALYRQCLAVVNSPC
jgi:hypothetical protein